MARFIRTPTGIIRYDNNFSDVDKDKLDSIERGAQVNTILGIKGSNEKEYRVGYITISKDDIGLNLVDNTADIDKNVNSALKLSRARNITIENQTVLFDGSKDINFTLNEIGAVSKSGDTINGNINVTGDSIFNSINVSGNTELESTLDVTGATTLNDILNVLGAVSFSNNLAVSGITKIKSTLDVTGATTLNDILNVTGSTSLNDTLTVSGTTKLKSTLDVTGNTTLKGKLDVVGDTNITGILTGTKISATTGFYGDLEGNASSANILKTARKINGTLFNGNEDITTIKWGAKRQITIGGTTKIIDGSEDVVWDITEIGVSAENHTHLYAGSTTSGGAANSLSYFSNSSTGSVGLETANNAIGYINGISLFGQTDGALFVQRYSEAWKAQLFIDYRTGQVATRGKNNGTWQDWRTQLDSGNYNSYALPLSGGALTGNVSLLETKNILLRPSSSNYTSGIGWDTNGNECLALWAKNSVSRLRWYAGKDMSTMTAGTMMGITPDFEISKASGTAKGYIGGTKISVEGHTHTKSQITDFPTSLPANGGTSSYTNIINGTYTSNGGSQPPSYIESGKVRFNMMNSFKGLSSLPYYADCILMDTYTGSDVPYVTGLGIIKASGNPRAFIAVGAKGNTTTWASQTELITGANIGSQSVNYATSSGNADTLSGFTGRNGRITWGELSNSKYSYITRFDTNNGGSIAFADYSGQTSMQIDGVFYQREGQYACIDTSTIGSQSVNYATSAATATKLATARTISLTGSVTGSASFDGSGNITISTSTNHSHSYLPLSGGTISGNLVVSGNFNVSGTASTIKLTGGNFNIDSSYTYIKNKLCVGTNSAVISDSNTKFFVLGNSGFDGDLSVRGYLSIYMEKNNSGTGYAPRIFTQTISEASIYLYPQNNLKWIFGCGCGNTGSDTFTIYKNGLGNVFWINPDGVNNAKNHIVAGGMVFVNPNDASENYGGYSRVVYGGGIYGIINNNGNYIHVNASTGSYGINWWASDTRLKKNIAPTKVNNVLDKINQIDFIEFDWKDETKGHVDIGLSANQLEEIIPEAVFMVEQDKKLYDVEYDSIRQINDNVIDVYALKAIQELSTKIKELEDKLSKYENAN